MTLYRTRMNDLAEDEIGGLWRQKDSFCLMKVHVVPTTLSAEEQLQKSPQENHSSKKPEAGYNFVFSGEVLILMEPCYLWQVLISF